MNEFDLIRHYFATQGQHRPDVRIGIGDDAAIVRAPRGHELAITTDTLVGNVHFSPNDLPADIGHKALAVNLSDLAAMGATPAWITLAITLPEADDKWLQGFSQGLFTLANRYHVQLIGGDVTRGPLSITIQAIGFTPIDKALLRSGAQPGDNIYVTGTIGDAGLGLRASQSHLNLRLDYQQAVLEKLHRPEPRIIIGEQLRNIASAAIDISDGLAADLNHILEESKVGAVIILSALPLSEALTHSLPADEAIMLALTAGDDYELCFTIPPDKAIEAEKILSQLSCRYTCIGTITSETRLTLQDEQGNIYHDAIPGYRHF